MNNNRLSAKSGRRSWSMARCLVTGASSGLGQALAEQLVKAGAQVILTGRSALRLQTIADHLIDDGCEPSRIVTIAADLTVEEDCQRLFDEITSRFQALDLVINSAGVGADGQFETHDPLVLRQVFEINFFALAEVCRRALPLLARGTGPAMINMGSIVARRGLPGRVEYSASKFAVSGFTEALRVEWSRFGIHVLQVNPGFTDTPFDQHVVASTARYSVAQHRRMSPQVVAQAALRAVERRKREITLSWAGWLLVTVNRIAPGFVDWGFTRWLLRYFPEAPVLQQNAARYAVANRAGAAE